MKLLSLPFQKFFFIILKLISLYPISKFQTVSKLHWNLSDDTEMISTTNVNVLSEDIQLIQARV